MKLPLPSLSLPLLLAITLFAAGGLAVLVLRGQQENRALRESVELLEKQQHLQREEYRREIQLLEGRTKRQKHINDSLKSLLPLLEKQRKTIIQKNHEDQNNIRRLGSRDSLYREIARHYE